ncbi:MAG: CBU_0592 family membrane protein [Alphaproteobacteria bacterium]
MNLNWYDFVGMTGVFFVLATYLLLQLKKVDPTTPLYSGLNALGAVLILISLYFNFNLSSALIECAWLLISLFGLVQACRTRK